MDDLINHYANKTVAITGASGYLASALTAALRNTPAHILRISRRDLPPIPGTETLRADVREDGCWEVILSKADVIFHLAGNTSVYAAADDPADSLGSTVLPITRLVHAARSAGYRPRVVYASTATVYGLAENVPVAEDVVPRPITNYDLHKLFSEKQLELASKQAILEGVSLRLANVYGPSQSTNTAADRGILNKIAKLAIQGEKLTVYGDGNYLRDYVYVDDVARAFIAAGIAEGIAGRSFNVAFGAGVTVRDAFNLVSEKAEKATGKKVFVENVPWPDGSDPIELRSFVADITSFEHATGWHPTICLAEGIDRLISVLIKQECAGDF